MSELTRDGKDAVEKLSHKHGFSPAAVTAMLEAVNAGAGSMAQFSHQEFGGSGQWMSSGMLMLSDMFNHSLKARVDALCRDLAELWAATPSPFVPRASTGSKSGRGDWWEADLGTAASVGSQNDTRYAWFPETRRLALEVGGQVTIYDTLEHRIHGFSQQQSGGASIAFTSQLGLVELSSLPVVSGAKTQQSSSSLRTSSRPSSERTEDATSKSPSEPAKPVKPHEPVKSHEPVTPDEPVKPVEPVRPVTESAAPSQSIDVFLTLEKLADLHRKGVLTDEEFSTKKAELLSRL